MGVSSLFLTISVLFQFLFCDALTDPLIKPTLFYPFGADVGDATMIPNDDGTSGAVPISVGFPYFNTSNTALFVNTNGAISFGVAITSFTPAAFPIDAQRLIALYWCDIDTRANNGRVYYRQSTDEDLLNRATNDVKRSFSSKGLYYFKAKWIFIATWHNVTYYQGSSATPVNSFQGVLITDGRHSIVMFNYGPMNWVRPGNPAQAGFNAGDDSKNFFVVSGSRTPSIIEIGNYSNVGQKGRWLFRVDSATIEVSSTCEATEKCGPHQNLDEKTDTCKDVAPSFECSTLEGPTVVNRRWVEFYCSVPTTEKNDQGRFNVTFLFDGEPDERVPSVVIKPSDRKATLHESQLYKRLGKWISCRVFSFWANSSVATIVTSKTLTSKNSYWAGIEISSDLISVHESDLNPVILTLKSTLPIACTQLAGNSLDPDICDLDLQVSTYSNDIVLRRRTRRECNQKLTEEDWKKSEQKAYRMEENIEIFAKVDSFMTAPRYSTIRIHVDPRKKRSASGEEYNDMWSKYRLQDILVFRHDAPQAVCRSTGDPNLTTFDRIFYPVYATGQFTYVQSTHGPPLEVQVRHRQCSQTVSCTCGVAVRERDIILVADMCKDLQLHLIKFSSSLPEGTGITTDDNRRSFEITLPGKVKVKGYVMSWGFNLEILVMPSERGRTEGLCGTFDGNNANDLKVKGTNQILTPYTYSRESLATMVESWRVPHGKSLFDGVRSDLPCNETLSDHGNMSFCTCEGGISSCQNTHIEDNTIPGSRPKRNVIPNDLPPGTIIPRRKREVGDNQSPSSTDNIDWEYDSTAFNESAPEPIIIEVVNTQITEARAREHCRKRLWDDWLLRDACSKVVNSSDVEGVINKCFNDVMLTGDLSWADDKIPEMQDLCLFEVMTSNLTESNTTQEEILSIMENITTFVCLPQDCSGHGTCQNGTCVCDKGFMGSDCALEKGAAPTIIRTLGPSSCDLETYPCQSVRLLTEKTTSLPTLTCKVEVTKMDSSKKSFTTSASMETLKTSICELPTKHYRDNFHINVNQTVETEPDFYLLPQGSPVLHYTVSISNDNQRFSDGKMLAIYNSKCQECSGSLCSQKEDSCLIRGYCFAKDERNPLNPDCDKCDPLSSNSSWTKISGANCDPCLSSPCPQGTTCLSPFKGKFRCSALPSDKATVILVVCLTIVGVILALVLVFVAIKCKKPSKVSDISEPSSEMKDLDNLKKSPEITCA